MFPAINNTSSDRDGSSQVLLQQLNESVTNAGTAHVGDQTVDSTAYSKPVNKGDNCDELLKMVKELSDDISADDNLTNQNNPGNATEDDTTDQLFLGYRKLLIDQETFGDDVLESSECSVSEQESDENAENDPEIEQYVAKLTAKRRKRKKRNFLCPVCGKLFNQQVGPRHFHLVHGSLARDKLCQICGKGFKTEQNLKEHAKTHATVARFKCSYPNCEKVFRMSRHKRRHEAAVHMKRVKSICVICWKKFPSKEQMEAHKSWHKPEDYPKCRICFAVMGSLISRRIHERRHKNEKYPCKYCDKQFFHHAALTAHQRIHTGELPYKCPKCSLAFSQHYSRVRHLKTHKEGEELLKCDQCDNHYRSKRDLNRHLKLHVDSSQEAKEVLLKCPTCKFQYRTLRGLRGHHLSSHGSPLCEEDLTGNQSDEKARQNSTSSLPQSTERTSESTSHVFDMVPQPSAEEKEKHGQNSLTRLSSLEKKQIRRCNPSDRGIGGTKRLLESSGSTHTKKQRLLEELADLSDVSKDDSMKLNWKRSTRVPVTHSYRLDEEDSKGESNSSGSESDSAYEPSDVDDECADSLEEFETDDENEEEICDEQINHVEDNKHLEDKKGREDEQETKVAHKTTEKEKENDGKNCKKRKMGGKGETNSEEAETHHENREEDEKEEAENTSITEHEKEKEVKQNEEQKKEKIKEIKMENECKDSNKDLIGDNLFTVGFNSLSNAAYEIATPTSSVLLPGIPPCDQEKTEAHHENREKEENTSITEYEKGKDVKQNEGQKNEKVTEIKMENECKDSNKDLTGDNLFTVGSDSLSNAAYEIPTPTSSVLLPAIPPCDQEKDSRINDIDSGKTPKAELTPETVILSNHANSIHDKSCEGGKPSVSNLNSRLQQETTVGTDQSFRTARLVLRKMNLEECLGGMVVIKQECRDVPERMLPKTRTWPWMKSETR